MGDFQEILLIILSLFTNFYSWKGLVYELETFKNCKEVKHVMIMIIAIIYMFFILCDIWLTVENYFQKILSLLPPLKKSTPP